MAELCQTAALSVSRTPAARTLHGCDKPLLLSKGTLSAPCIVGCCCPVYVNVWGGCKTAIEQPPMAQEQADVLMPPLDSHAAMTH